MKNIFRILVAVSVLIAFSTTANAQNPVPGDQVTYQVTDHSASGYTYQWSLDDGGSFSGATTNASATIDWTTPGTYTITLVESNGTCVGANNTLSVTVDGATLEFAAASSASCADAAESLALTYNGTATSYPLTVNYDVDNSNNDGATANRSLIVNNAGELAIALDAAADRADQAAFADYNVVVTITGVTDTYGNTGGLGQDTYTDTVNDIPDANVISPL